MLNIERKTISGKTAFTFSGQSAEYVVKNFGQGDIYVAFDESATSAESIRIPSMVGQFCINTDNQASTIYVTGNGEVEVQQL